MPIEQHAPGLERIVDLHQQIEELASGFGGERGGRAFSVGHPGHGGSGQL